MCNVTEDKRVPPPRQVKPSQVVPLREFWSVLPPQIRQQTLATLSRMVAQNLQRTTTQQEVGYD